MMDKKFHYIPGNLYKIVEESQDLDGTKNDIFIVAESVQQCIEKYLAISNNGDSSFIDKIELLSLDEGDCSNFYWQSTKMLKNKYDKLTDGFRNIQLESEPNTRP